MSIKKRLIENSDYYEYSSDYVKKYILIAFIILIVAIIIFLSIYLPYNLVPKKSFMKSNTPTIIGDNIMNSKGIYYTGTFTNIPKSIPIKEDMKEIFVDRFNKIFEKEFWLMTKDEFLNKYHFLGYGNKHYKVDDFIGNYIALSVDGSMIRLETFLAEGKPIKKSTHCGLSKEEMEVPVIVVSK